MRDVFFSKRGFGLRNVCFSLALIALAGVGFFAFKGCAEGGTGTTTNELCGNGVRDSEEQCEGFDLGGQSCTTLQLGSGTLACKSDCTYDTSGCSANAACGNGIREGSEACDGMDLNDMTCALLNLESGTLRCNADCTYDTSECTGGAECGDGVVQGGEECDGSNLAGKTCQTLGEGFEGGTLGCSTSCTYDTSECTASAECGNEVIESGEMCDGENYGGITCVSLGYAGGQLQCSSDCQLDTSGCSQGQAEECDNEIDDDGDGFIDCDDADCYSDPACGGSSEICNNGIDDDNDGYVDCDDGDCSSDPACSSSGEICDNGTDDDGNFLCDCMDIFSCAVDCLFYPAEEENCGDGLDEDHDCLVDCDDPDCDSAIECGGTPEVCDNDIDDDGDGDIDCDDSDCAGIAGCYCYPLYTVSCGDTVSESTSGEPNYIEEYTGCGNYPDTGPEVSFLFSTGTAGTVTLNLDAGTVDLDLAVVQESGDNCDPAGSCVEMSQDTGGVEELEFSATASTNYYIIVDGYDGAEGSFSLTVTCTP